jgi:hypothetical protein
MQFALVKIKDFLARLYFQAKTIFSGVVGVRVSEIV